MSGGTTRKPTVLAILVCDGVHICPTTRKSTILGTFNFIRTGTLPLRWPFLCVYTSLTGGQGETGLQVKLVRANTDEFSDHEVVATPRAVIRFPDPLAVVDMPVAFNNVEFDAPGEHRFQIVHADSGDVLAERKFAIHYNPPQPSETGESP